MLQRIIDFILVGFIVFLSIVVGVGAVQKEQGEHLPNTTNRQTTGTTTTPTPVVTANSKTPGIPTVLSLAEISKHNQKSDCWLLINNQVYDVTSFLRLHPGGSSTIIPFCGSEATSAFKSQNGQGSHSSRADGMLADYFLGSLNQAVSK
jgi:cytochrome b involved in lipid metabolism